MLLRTSHFSLFTIHYSLSLTGDRRMKNRFAGEPRDSIPQESLRRIRSLVRKEFVQVIRDPSSIAIALVLPVFLILLFGYGLSLDVKDVPVAVVLENPTPDSAGLAGAFKLSDYFKVTEVTSMQEAVKLMRDHEGGRHRALIAGLRPATGFGRRPGPVDRPGRRRQPRPLHPGLCPGRARTVDESKSDQPRASHPGIGPAPDPGCGSMKLWTAIISWCRDWSYSS